MNKICCYCKIKQPVKEFFKDIRYKDGYNSGCRSCRREKTKLYKQTEVGKKKTRERMREYRRTEKWKKYYKKYTEKRREKNNLWMKMYRKLPKVKKRQYAYKAVHDAIKLGVLTPKPCEKCNEKENIQAHHHMGYEKINWLNVKWLCQVCHGEDHRLK